MDTDVHQNQKIKLLNYSKELTEIRLDEFHELLEFIDNSIREECQKIEKRYIEIVKPLHVEGKEDDEDFSWLSDTYGENYFKLDKIFRNMLHYSYIVTLYTFLETQLNKICDIMKNYLDNIELGYTDLANKGIKRAKTYLTKVVKVEFPSNSQQWQEIQTLNKIRNIIVHCEGHINKNIKDKDKKSLNNYAMQHSNYISFSEHKQIILTQKYCLFITNQVMKFFEQFYSANLQRQL